MSKQQINADQIDDRGGVWQEWTPSYANITVGNGTVTAKYTQIGKTVLFFYKLVFGSTSGVSGIIGISPPLTALDSLQSFSAYALDSGTTRFLLLPFLATTTQIQVYALGAGSTYVAQASTSSTVPMTWATGDTLVITGTYEAA